MSDRNKLKFNITGMSCAACVACVDGATRSVDGVVDCNVNLLTNSMEVLLSDDVVTGDVSDTISDAVSKAGYRAVEVDSDLDDEAKVRNINDSYKKDINNHITRLISSGILLLILMYLSMGGLLRMPNMPESSNIW